MDSYFLIPLEKPSRRLKIAYVGNFLHPHCTEVHIKKSLEGLGHEVVAIQEKQYPPIRDTINVETILEASRECDLWLYTRTWGMMPAGERDGIWLLNELKKLNIPTAALHLDLYVGLAREADISSDNPFWATDFVFTADGGHQDFFKARGINHHHFSPGILDTEAYLGTPRKELMSDIVFVGSYKNYPPEWPFRQRLIEWLQETYGSRLTLWVDGKGVRNQELNDLYASVKIAIGDSIYSPNYWSDRYFETTGRGGFLIAPNVPGLEEYFPNDLLTTFDNEKGQLTDFSKLKKLIDYYLENDGEREILRRRCFEHVRKNHTYMHRMKDVLEIIDRDNHICSNTPIPKAKKELPMKKCLNVGSGNDPLLPRFPFLENHEMVNVDIMDFGNNVVHDLSVFPWPFETDTFDEIIAIDIIEHFWDAVAFVNETLRVCKPGGHIFVQAPSAAFPEAVWADPEHVRGLTEKSFDFWVKGSLLNQHYGQSKTKGRFFITDLVVEKLNLNLTFSFRKDSNVTNTVEIHHGNNKYVIQGWGPEELVFRSIKITGEFYEAKELDAIKEMKIEGTYVDVGANIGNHSVFFAAECPSDFVIAIEAHKPLLDLAEINLQRNVVQEKWRTIHAAIVNNDTSHVDMWLAGDINMGRSQLPKPGKVASDVNLSGKTIRVPCARLDALLGEISKIGLIKLDIEGDEVAALKSGWQTIKKHRPVIASECSEGWNQEPNAEMLEISELLEPLGYILYAGPIGYAQGPMYIWKA